MEEKEKEEIKKKVDESWKDTVEKEKSTKSDAKEEPLRVTFNLFISGLMMEALIALGDVEHPLTKKKEINITHAKFIIDTISMLQDKTKNNLDKDESSMLDSILYELRMRFVAKTKSESRP